MATRLRTLLLTDGDITAKVGPRIHQATVPEDTQPPFIFFKRTNVRFERALGESGVAAFSHTFDVECVGMNLNDSQELADEIRSYDGYIGTFGDSTCKGIFVNEHTDEYESEFGDHVASLSVEVIPA